MEEFSKYYEREDVEMVTNIPSGFIRKGLFLFLSLIIILIALSCFIRVNKYVLIQSKILTDQPIKIDVAPFGNNIAANFYGRDSSAGIKSENTFRGISYIHNAKEIVVVKRNFGKLKDSIFTIQPNTNIKLFVTNGDTSKSTKLILGQQVEINYPAWEYSLRSRIVNIFNNSDGSYTYQLDVAQLPDPIKYSFLSTVNQTISGRVDNVKITLFQQICSNLFNKVRI